MQNEFLGFSLFNDIEDEQLRARNRGVVMTNMYEDHCDKETAKLTPQWTAKLLKYFNYIPEAERALAMGCFSNSMSQRGFKV